MKIAYNHLIQHIESKPSIKKISDKLFQLGHEHEIDNDIFDIEFTPNRGDCLSINGLLRDLSAFYDINLIKDVYEKSLEPFLLDFTNKSEASCSNISFLRIDIEEEVLPYKGPLKNYFSDLKINKNNLFTDISNYISYELGQPTHCYDQAKLQGNISLEKVNGSFKFDTLLGKTVNLSGKNLVFLNNNEIINLAGVVGGESTACSSKTRSVLIECACFNPEEIIGKSVKYDIQSEAAHKFERGVDRTTQEKTLRRFIKILETHATIKNLQIFSGNFMEYNAKVIPLDVSIINRIIGISISNNDYKTYLTKLGFQITENNIIVPSFRNDVTSQNDLAEEIARVIGYDNIPLKKISIQKPSNSYEKDIESMIKIFLVDNGFYEVINPPFVSEKTLSSIKVDNPLDSNREYLRTNLKRSLINNLIYNERRQKDSIKIFEISDIYKANSNDKKNKVIGIIASGRVGKNYEDFSKKIDNKYLSGIFDKFIPGKVLQFENIPRNELDTKSKNLIVYLEIEINEFSTCNYSQKLIPKSLDEYIRYKPISDFPSSFRDISFSIKDFSQFKNLEKILLNFNHDILKEVFIFDYFKNEKMNEIKVGFRFIFQSKHGTITYKDVDIVLDEIIKSSLSIDSISIPGLKNEH